MSDIPEVLKPQTVPGEEKTSYLSPGQEIKDYYKREFPPSPISSVQWADDVGFVNAALALSDALAISLDDAVVALLVAKATNPDFDLGFLARHTGGKAEAVAESLRRNRFVIQEAINGSIEQKHRNLVKALNQEKERFEAGDGWVYPLATHECQTVAINHKGDIFRVTYSEEKDCISIVDAKKLTAREVKSESIKSRAKVAVEAILEGKKNKAKIALVDLMRMATREDATEFAKARYQHIFKDIREDNFWKTYIRDNSPRIRLFCRGELREINNSGIRPRFHEIRKRGVNPKYAEQYRSVLRKALSQVGEKFQAMRDALSENFTKDSWLVNSLSSYDKEFGLSTANFLNYYTGELLNSLTTVAEGIRLAIGENDLQFQALLYDTLAEEFPIYGLAYLFARKALSDIRSGV